MKLKFAIPATIATAAACLAFAQPTCAQTYAGGSTAGNLPATAEVIPGIAGVTYTAISGTTSAMNAVYNAEMYEITFGVAEYFTASTTKFVAGANNFDTQLFLFNSSGVGVLANDDAASGGDQSSLSTGTMLLAPGNYYLLIAGSGNYPVSSTGLIFPNYTDGTTDPSGTYGPTGAGGANPITAYTGNTNEGGNYVISLTFAVPVPEPGTYALVFAGLAGLVLIFRMRGQTVG